MPLFHLPGRAHPYPDELPEAWLVRLAEANHCTVRALLRHIGVQQRDFALTDWENVWLVIERALGIGLNDFQRDHDNALSRLYGTALLKHRSPALRICPECFKTLDYLPIWTKTIYSYVCDQHEVALIDKCSSCNADLSYLFNEVGAFLCCQQCKTPYGMMNAPSIPTTVAHYQHMVNRSAIILSTDHAAFFEVSRGNAAARPFYDELHRRGHGYHPFEGRRRLARYFTVLGVVINGVEDIYSVSHLVFSYSRGTKKISVPRPGRFSRPYLEEVAEKIHASLHRHYGYRLGR